MYFTFGPRFLVPNMRYPGKNSIFPENLFHIPKCFISGFRNGIKSHYLAFGKFSMKMTSAEVKMGSTLISNFNFENFWNRFLNREKTKEVTNNLTPGFQGDPNFDLNSTLGWLKNKISKQVNKFARQSDAPSEVVKLNSSLFHAEILIRCQTIFYLLKFLLLHVQIRSGFLKSKIFGWAAMNPRLNRVHRVIFDRLFCWHRLENLS